MMQEDDKERSKISFTLRKEQKSLLMAKGMSLYLMLRTTSVVEKVVILKPMENKNAHSSLK